MKKRKVMINILKWTSLSLAVLFNSFIVAYSCFDDATTQKMNRFVTNIFSGIVNTFTQKEVKTIPVKGIDVHFSSDQYNNIPGYATNQIPLGSAKQVECTFTPTNATNKTASFSSDDNDIAQIVQSGSFASVVGMGVGITNVNAINSTSGLTSSTEVEVIDLVEPQAFTVSLDDEVAIGNTITAIFDIDGGVLGHNELINSRYYDIKKLSFVSSNTSVATIDNNGVIYPLHAGTTEITISNTLGQSFNKVITILNGSSPSPYQNLSISGSNICYENDMILDQNSGNKHYQLSISDGETELNAHDFIWTSSDELLARMDRHGILRGFRKRLIEDESVTITAKSKLTGQEVNFDVTVKKQLPEEMYYWIQNGNKKIWNPVEHTVCVGDNVTINVGYDPVPYNKNVVVENYNPELLDYTTLGSSFVLHINNTGTARVRFTCEINPELSAEIKLTILRKGAIDSDNYDDVSHNLRKAIGHSLLFMFAQIFTFLTLYLFIKDKKLWFYPVISIFGDLFLAILSEVIQHFVPTRTGSVVDVLIDLIGVLIGAAIVFVPLVIRKTKRKKQTDL